MSVNPDFSSQTYTRKCIQLKHCKSYCLSRAAVCCKTACGAAVVDGGITDLSSVEPSSSTYQGATLSTQAACCPFLTTGDTFTINGTYYTIVQIKPGKIVAAEGAKSTPLADLLAAANAVVLHGSDGHVCRADFYSGSDAVENALHGSTLAAERYRVSNYCAGIGSCSAQVGTTSCDCECIAQCDC